MGQDHGGGDHPLPSLERHGDHRQLPRRDRRVDSAAEDQEATSAEAQREALYKAVYDTDYWKTKIAPRVPECLDRDKMVITRIVPTPKSTVA